MANMSSEKIVSFRMQDGNVVRIERYDTVPSVENIAAAYAKSGYPDRYCIFSENQFDTSLTGTKLKDDGSTDRGIFLSLILRPSIFPSQATLLGPMCAVALTEALAEHTESPLGIRWVSDVFCEGKKIGGTALEGKLDSFSSYEYIIVHFAVHIDEEIFPPRLADLVRVTFEPDFPSVSLIIAKSILTHFFELYPNLKTSAKFMERYQKLLLFRGKTVHFRDGDKRLRVKILSVDPTDAALLAEMPDGTVRRITSRAAVELPNRIKTK